MNGDSEKERGKKICLQLAPKRRDQRRGGTAHTIGMVDAARTIDGERTATSAALMSAGSANGERN
jgi:hypothetical protein